MTTQQPAHFFVATPDESNVASYDALRALLHKARETLGMDVVFVSEFTRGVRRFLCVEAAPGENDVAEGNADPLEASYCQRIVDGRLPQLIPDAMADPVARELPATHAVRVGGHLSVPIVLRNGEVFGTLCCFCHRARPDLAQADLETLRALAELVAAGIDKHGLLREKLWPEPSGTPAPHH